MVTRPDMRDLRDRRMIAQARQVLLSHDKAAFRAMVAEWTAAGWSQDRRDGFILEAQRLAERGTELDVRDASPQRHHGKAGQDKPVGQWSASSARFTADKRIRFGSDR